MKLKAKALGEVRPLGLPRATATAASLRALFGALFLGLGGTAVG